MPTRSQRIRQAVRGGPIDKLRAEVQDLKEQVKEVKTNHVIHSDGTYSNPHNTVNLKDQIRHRSLLILNYKGQERREVVRDFNKSGVWTKPATMKENPSLHQCNFWKWSEIDASLREVRSL